MPREIKIEAWVSERSHAGWKHARRALGIADLTVFIDAVGEAWFRVDFSDPPEFLDGVADVANDEADVRASRRRRGGRGNV